MADLLKFEALFLFNLQTYYSTLKVEIKDHLGEHDHHLMATAKMKFKSKIKPGGSITWLLGPTTNSQFKAYSYQKRFGILRLGYF